MGVIMEQRRVSIERFAEIYRAMDLRPLPDDADVTFEEVEDIVNACTFGEFIERNRGTVQLYEEAV